MAQSFANEKGLIFTSNIKQIVCGLDISIISRFDNESEIWIFDQIFPIQRAMVLDENINVRIKYIINHLLFINHSIKNVKSFLRLDR